MKQELFQFLQLLPYLQFQTSQLYDDLKWYFDFVNTDDLLTPIQQIETFEGQMKMYEKSFRRIEETIQRRKNIDETSNTLKLLMEMIENKLNLLESTSLTDYQNLYKANNDIVDSIIQLKEQEVDNEIDKINNYVQGLYNELNQTKEIWLQKKINMNEMNMNKNIETNEIIENEIKETEQVEIKETNEMNELEESKESKELQNESKLLSNEEIQQIQTWTQKKIGQILFDSNEDDWKTETSNFDDKLLNKQNLLIVVEDTDGNKFGGFVSSQITQCNNYINDSNAFLFSLQSNGRLNGMKRFEIKDSKKAFLLSSKSEIELFGMGSGYDLCVRKQDAKSHCCCFQSSSFYYHGLTNALVGKSVFVNIDLKHFVVIQMN